MNLNVSEHTYDIQAWLGIDDPLAAAQYLASAKIPCSFYTSGSSISHVQLQHIYVEAFIPYGNYRGTGEDDKGKAWVPMDPVAETGDRLLYFLPAHRRYRLSAVIA